MKIMKKIATMFLPLCLSASLLLSTAQAKENPFQDVSRRDYYYDAVIWAVENGITGGTTPDTFSPDKTCNRAQVVTFLWRAAGKPDPVSEESPFTDVDEEQYFYRAVLWAVEQGITAGIGATTFSPYDICTRAQVLTFVWRSVGKPSSGSEIKNGAYYTQAVAWANGAGILEGSDFIPTADCPRCDIVTYLYRAENAN